MQRKTVVERLGRDYIIKGLTIKLKVVLCITGSHNEYLSWERGILFQGNFRPASQ